MQDLAQKKNNNNTKSLTLLISTLQRTSKHELMTKKSKTHYYKTRQRKKNNNNTKSIPLSISYNKHHNMSFQSKKAKPISEKVEKTKSNSKISYFLLWLLS